jgi:hypothetical protein
VCLLAGKRRVERDIISDHLLARKAVA